MEHWIKNNPDQLLEAINSLRQRSDQAIDLLDATGYELEINDRNLERAQERLIQFRVKTANGSQRDTPAATPTPSSASSITKSKIRRFPDPPVFSETNGYVTLDDWAKRIKDKLCLNGDDIGDDHDWATYVISRTGGTAARHILAYRINDANYFKTPEQVISTLHEIMGDPNRRNVIRHSVKTLRQKNGEAFYNFFSNFRMHSTYLQLGNRAAMEELMDKLNIRM